MAVNLIQLMDLSLNTLFDDIVLPDNIDKDIMIATIFDEGAEFMPYSVDVDFMKQRIKIFFKRYYNDFLNIATTLEASYNPLENYDKQSDITVHMTSVDDNEVKTSVSAYDSSSYQPSDKAETDNSRTDDTHTTERTHGNIGVTTSQQMLESEMSLRKKYNIYMIIADRFIRDLMISVL